MSRKHDDLVTSSASLIKLELTGEEYARLNKLLGNPEPEDFLDAICEVEERISILEAHKQKAIDAGKEAERLIKEAAQKAREDQKARDAKELERLKAEYTKEVEDLKDKLMKASVKSASSYNMSNGPKIDPRFLTDDQKKVLFDAAAKLREARKDRDGVAEDHADLDDLMNL